MSVWRRIYQRALWSHQLLWNVFLTELFIIWGSYCLYPLHANMSYKVVRSIVWAGEKARSGILWFCVNFLGGILPAFLRVSWALWGVTELAVCQGDPIAADSHLQWPTKPCSRAAERRQWVKSGSVRRLVQAVLTCQILPRLPPYYTCTYILPAPVPALISISTFIPTLNLYQDIYTLSLRLS